MPFMLAARVQHCRRWPFAGAAAQPSHLTAGHPRCHLRSPRSGQPDAERSPCPRRWGELGC